MRNWEDGSSLRVCRIRVCADSSRSVGHILPHDKVWYSAGGLLTPTSTEFSWTSKHESWNIIHSLSHCIRPTFSHPTSLRGLQASSCSASSHAVCDTMGHFMGDNVVLKSSVTLRLRVLLQNEYNRQFCPTHCGQVPEIHSWKVMSWRLLEIDEGCYSFAPIVH